MALTLEELVIQISADNKQLAADLKSASAITASATKEMAASIKKLSEDGEKSTSFLSGALEVFSGVILEEVVMKAFEAAFEVAQKFFELVLNDGVKSAIAEQDALNRLSQALGGAGQYSKEAAERFREFSEEMQHTTHFEKDAIISTAALIENIAHLGEHDLQQATKATADFAAAMGIDLEAAARIVGKAIEGNVVALNRYGITIAEGTGKADQFGAVLAKLNASFGGAAAAQVATFSGQMDQLKKAFDDVLKVFGNTIVQNKAVVDAMGALTGIFRDLVENMTKNKQVIREFVAEGLLFLIDATQGVLIALDATVKGIELVGHAAIASALALQALQSPVYVATNLPLIIGQFEAMSKTMKGDTVFIGIAEQLTKVRDAAAIGFSEVKKGAEIAEPAVKNNTKAVLEFNQELQRSADAGKDLAKTLIDESNNVETQYQMQLEMLKAHLDGKKITEDEYWAQRSIATQKELDAEVAQLQAARDTGKITEQRYHDAIGELNHKANLKREKDETEYDTQRKQNTLSTLNYISSLSQSKNKELAVIGKAAAIAQATYEGYVAVQVALASAPPPFNFALAALVGAAAAVNVANIAGVGLASGIDEVPGSGFQDNFAAVLAPGERVVDRQTNRDLKSFLDSQGGGGSSGGGAPVNIHINVGGHMYNTREEALHIVNVLNEHTQRSGLKLLGSRI